MLRLLIGLGGVVLCSAGCGLDAMLPGPQPSGDIDRIRVALQDWHAYAPKNPVVHERLAALAAQPSEAPEAFAWQLQEVLAASVDGHARVRPLEDSGMFLPALLVPIGDRIIALEPTRQQFVDPNHPYLVAIDDVPIERWREAAQRWVPQGSDALVRSQTTQYLRHIDRLRASMSLPGGETATLTLQGEDGAQVSVSLDTTPTRPHYGTWPNHRSTVLDDSIGYLRIDTMEASTLAHVKAWLRTRSERITSLIIDVRGNPGGDRDIMRLMDGQLGPGPRVVNVARMRLSAPFPADHLARRGLCLPDDARWSALEREPIQGTLERFQPTWAPAEGYGPWHVAVLPGSPDPLHIPVVILLDERCLSSTDIFLAAFAPLPNVTTMGTPSGGASGLSVVVQVPWAEREVMLSSMASYQVDGQLFDGVGVLPERTVMPIPTDHLRQGTDSVRDAALAFLRHLQAAQPGGDPAP